MTFGRTGFPRLTVPALVLFLLPVALPAGPLIDLTNICAPKTEESAAAPNGTSSKSPGEAACLEWYVGRGFQEADLAAPPAAFVDRFERAESFPIWVNKLLPSESAFETFTFVTYFDAPPELLEPGSVPGVSFGEIGEVFEVYVNGQLIAREGEHDGNQVTHHRTVRGVVYQIDRAYLRQGRNQLLVKIQGDPRFDHTGFYLQNDYMIGFYDELRERLDGRLALVLIGLYLFVGLYHFLLYSKRPMDRYNLYFAVFCIGVFVYLMTRHNVIFETPWDSILIQKVELCVLYMMMPFQLMFYEEMFEKRITWISKGILIFVTALALPTIVLPLYLAEPLLRIWQFSALPFFFLLIFFVVRARFRKNDDAGRMLAGLIVVLLTATYDILDSAFWNTGIGLTRYGFFMFIAGIAFVLANRFLRVHNQVEELNANLEQKVEERTRQLRSSLHEINELKVQQDGDYYLTSLLIEPLSGGFVDSPAVRIELLVEQKKKFKFRKWDAEIGGDLAAAHSINLRGRRYVSFVNGDAMGKSIQGAGGALVLGVVYKSVISRTQLSSQAGDKSPERWLKDCFAELQNTFVSFDGTMLLSAVLGLLDEESGTLYYINAEHPWVVLYRQGRASFLENEEQLLHKIGVQMGGQLRVKTFQMEPGDIVISGSDGRDDIVVGEQNGMRVINEDEGLFLKRVEDGRGVPGDIRAAIKEQGELSDDLSLLLLAYKEDWAVTDPDVLEERDAALVQARDLGAAGDWRGARRILEAEERRRSGDPETVLALARVSHKIGDRSAARDYYLRYVEMQPIDSVEMYRASYACKLSGDLDRAADLGESVRMREPENVRNLINLGDVYRLLGVTDRARQLLEEARGFADPEEKMVRQLQEKLSV